MPKAPVIRRIDRIETAQKITVEYAPGKTCQVPCPEGQAPKFVLARLRAKPGNPGEFIAEPYVFEPYVRLTSKLPEQLGLDGLTYYVLRRLMAAGFIQYRSVTPQCNEINLASLYDFLHATRSDAPTCFWTKSRILKWSESAAKNPLILGTSND